MDSQQVNLLQKLCEKYDAIGCEIWFVGIRFYLANGKMSKIVSRKGLNLEVGQVWINLNNFKTNKNNVLKRIHPDTSKDTSWSTQLTSFVNTNLFSQREARFRLDDGRIKDTIDQQNTSEISSATYEVQYPGSSKRYTASNKVRSYTAFDLEGL